MYSPDDVWQAVKELAHKYAEVGKRPSPQLATAKVRALFATARLQPAPSDDIIEMYAEEMLAQYDACTRSVS